MLKGFFNAHLPEQGEPEIVRWTAGIVGHTCWESPPGFDVNGKDARHGAVVVGVSAPSFDRDAVSVYFGVTNLGRKALGLGAAGVVLALGARGQAGRLASRALYEKRRGRGMASREVDPENLCPLRTAMADAGESVDFSAEFPAAERPDYAEVAIQANRILARPLLFIFPFDLCSAEVGTPTTVGAAPASAGPTAAPEAVGQVHAFCFRCGANLQPGARFCHICGEKQPASGG
jgi:hypothetical protein